MSPNPADPWVLVCAIIGLVASVIAAVLQMIGHGYG